RLGDTAGNAARECGARTPAGDVTLKARERPALPGARGARKQLT
ncbi:jg14897, partial [Pararge aegeria aegeria]